MTDRIFQKKRESKNDRFSVNSYGSKKKPVREVSGKASVDTSSMGAVSIIKAIGFAFITALLLVLVLSLLATFYDIPDSVLNGIIVAISILSLFIVGFKTATYNKEKGLLMGVMSGIVYSMILYALAFMVWKSVTFSPESLINILAGSAISGMGGFIGINRLAKAKRRRK